MTQPGPRPATAVTVFHADGDDAEFARWAGELLASARDADGYRSGRVSDVVDPTSDRAVAVTFSGDTTLHRWLDSPGRAEVLRDGRARGFWTATTDLVTSAENLDASGISVFGHVVSAGRDDEFRATQARLSSAAAALPGYLGTVLVAGERDGEWTSVVRFRTGTQLAQWLASAERGAALDRMRGTLSRDFSTGTTPFGTTVRVQDGRTLMTPNWKSAMLVLAVLYPTVMLLSRFLGPVVDHAGAPPWLGLWISQIVSIVAMQWWLMPAASRPLRRWLDPVDGSGAGVSATGVAVIVAVYVVTLTVFATVHELQFWDYAS
ncbi:MAG: antibiotic biosynthesis monooxygenase [Mycobacterium kyogaense]|uniref:antibiotic biosynthesis monooxygenase n=1 Tax=Mycobacterium kyogaense TaxID=2212479 RepID=UPI002FF95E3C